MPKDFQTKRELGLCYKCDEKYTPSHVCQFGHINFILADESYSEEYLIQDVEKEGLDDQGQLLENDEQIKISLNALSGNVSFKTIRIKGFIKNREVSMLIDSGSTHSFIDEGLAKQLQCKLMPTKPLGVPVADGTKLYSRFICSPLIWRMDGLEFQH